MMPTSDEDAIQHAVRLPLFFLPAAPGVHATVKPLPGGQPRESIDMKKRARDDQKRTETNAKPVESAKGERTRVKSGIRAGTIHIPFG
jgi:hypothetical protein